jgi:hypothetical protein
MNTNHIYPDELLDFYDQNKNGVNSTYNTYQESNLDLSCAYYPIKFDFDSDLLLKECREVDDLYFNHRGQDKKKGYGHYGWQSLTLHGIDKHKTEHYTKYGFTSSLEAGYHWTDACERVPNLYCFLSGLPFTQFDRVRIMRLAPGGYIMPHSDNKFMRAFSPLNIAINNPEGCHFVFKDRGIVPFAAGYGMVLDVGQEHMVINDSNEVRYHIIVHGTYDKGFYSL